MLSFTSAEIAAWIGALLWPFARIMAIIGAEPILGSRMVPARVKVGVGFLLTLAIAPTLGPMPAVEPGSPAGLLILMQQVLIGLAIGFTMRIVFTSAEMAGHLAGLQMGLGFAMFFDPQNSAQVSVVGQFMGLLTILIFFAVNGHLMVISALAGSFGEIPISADPFAAGGFLVLARWGAKVFEYGVWLSLPVVAALLIANLAIGVMSRAAPQLNIFAVGFPITLLAGFVVLYLALPYLLPLIERLIMAGVETMLAVPRQLGAR